MSVRMYTWEDADAPQLDDQPGSLVQLLDAVLVNGYSSGGTETLPLGWEIAFTGADKRAYRSLDSAASGCLLRVQDDITPDNDGGRAYVRAYESMSDIDTGTGETPKASQQPMFVWSKAHNNWDSGSNNSVPWWIVGDERFFIFVHSQTSGNNGPLETQYAEFQPFIFGDIVPFDADDNACIILGKNSERDSDSTVIFSNEARDGFSAQDEMVFVVTSIDGVTNDVPMFFMALGVGGDEVGAASATFDYPNVVTGNFLVTDVYCKEHLNGVHLRGILPGIKAPLSQISSSQYLTTLPGTTGGGLGGRDLFLMPQEGGDYAIDITGPWR